MSFIRAASSIAARSSVFLFPLRSVARVEASGSITAIIAAAPFLVFNCPKKHGQLKMYLYIYLDSACLKTPIRANNE